MPTRTSGSTLAPASGDSARVGVPARRSPDIVLLAPSAQTFTRGRGDHPSSNHGSLSYSTTRVPTMFFGPAIDGVHMIAVADMIDFTPSVLALLGIDSTPFGLD